MANKTVANLIAEVRSLVDESNNAHLDDRRDIIPALNRAQDAASMILLLKDNSPLLANMTVTLASTPWTIPEDCFEDAITKVEIKQGPYYREVARMDYREITSWEGPGSSVYPQGYYLMNRQMITVPPSAGEARVWYIKQPPQLDYPLAQITAIDRTNNLVIVRNVQLDENGDPMISSDIDSEASFVSFIDSNTGRVKGSIQVQLVDSGDVVQVEFRGTPSRNTVNSTTVSGTIPADVEVGDYLNPIGSSCIPYVYQPITNFIIYHSVVDVKKIVVGSVGPEDYDALKRAEVFVERLWASKANAHRVKNTSQIWRKKQSRLFVR